MMISTDFEKLAKQNKRRSIFKMVAISVMLSLLLIMLSFVGLNRLTSKNGQKIQQYYTIISEIAYPNISYSSWGYDATSQFTGHFVSHRFKDIDGISVPFEKYEHYYSLILSQKSSANNNSLMSGDNGHSMYTRASHYKVPVFFNKGKKVQLGAIKPTQDIPLLHQMSGQAVEVAVTFDKGYTLKEIEQFIPKNLKLNWIWSGIQFDYLESQFGFTPYFDLGLSDEQQKKMEAEIDKAYKSKKHPDLNPIYQKYDPKSAVSPVEGMENSYTVFQNRLEQYLKMKENDWHTVTSKHGEVYSSKAMLKEYLRQNKDPKTAKFDGVILTGRAENFAQLQNVDWVYASNIGQSIQIQPYHQLEK
ncbi:hypothetical protein FMV2238Y02_09790 [Streptococcus canis]|uniref:Sigma factor regulator C-terminal domain-containing protein n=1 Tax=Streptococcus canis TaxID=1329 RepID=A0A3P5Y266_STRCB|nr:anti sigma factor C-terminal domain-containing protein [Streptococcus canis]MDV5973681.1 anti sigma factor C-terminal domain-containing protein [Streptococcus canis]QKG77208.1 anti sigma factor C-terminal domain-containing protein [Streptococcus canis]VDC42531.1 hypothetical protein FMV2238Y02_09790 [Streptococcus canis]